MSMLLAAGDPEARAIANASHIELFGSPARVATLEDLLLLYLYSNQMRHLGDFERIVKSGRADLARSERALYEMHREMLPLWRTRLQSVLSPNPAPKKPRRKTHK